MAQYLKIKFLISLKLNEGSFLSINIKICFFQKVEKSHCKIVKLEVENFEHLCSKTRVNLLRRRRAQKSLVLEGWVSEWVCGGMDGC